MHTALIRRLLPLAAALPLVACDNGETSADGGTMMTTAGVTAPTAGATAGALAPVSGAMTLPPMGGVMTMPPMGGAMTMPPMGGDTPVGGGSCVDIVNCIQNEMCADQACFEGCVVTGSPSAQATFATFASCLQGASMTCGQDQNCIAMTCQSEILACQSGGGTVTPPPQRDLSCPEVMFCASQCAPTDAACQQRCISAVSAEGAPALNSYLMCLQTNMCQTEECVQTNCSAQYDACIPPGTQGCNSVLTCLTACRDEQCAFNCQLQADAEAQMLLSSLSSCFEMNACMDLSCPACSAQVSSCQAD
jgi:hypothetical protein